MTRIMKGRTGKLEGLKAWRGRISYIRGSDFGRIPKIDFTCTAYTIYKSTKLSSMIVHSSWLIDPGIILLRLLLLLNHKTPFKSCSHFLNSSRKPPSSYRVVANDEPLRSAIKQSVHIHIPSATKATKNLQGSHCKSTSCHKCSWIRTCSFRSSCIRSLGQAC